MIHLIRRQIIPWNSEIGKLQDRETLYIYWLFWWLVVQHPRDSVYIIHCIDLDSFFYKRWRADAEWEPRANTRYLTFIEKQKKNTVKRTCAFWCIGEDEIKIVLMMYEMCFLFDLLCILKGSSNKGLELTSDSVQVLMRHPVFGYPHVCVAACGFNNKLTRTFEVRLFSRIDLWSTQKSVIRIPLSVATCRRKVKTVMER